jgi:hypothetical protein
MKRIQKTLGLIFLSFLVVCFAPLATAGNLAPAQQDPNAIPGDVGIESTQYIKSYNTSIYKTATSTVKVNGYTESYSSVDTIGVKIYLQTWTDGMWADVAYVGEFKKTNASYTSGSGEYPVTKGNYYRVKGVHYVNHDGNTEQVNYISSYVYID